MVNHDEISRNIQMEFRVHLEPKLTKEMTDRWDWCRKTVGECGIDFDMAPPFGMHYDPTVWFFKREEDAVIFALKWS
jgi:hypothetical protein